MLEAGLVVTPGAFTSAIGAVAVGRITDWRRRRIAVVVGALLVAGVGLWMEQELSTEPRFLEFWLPAGLISGLGMGAVFTGVATAAAMSLPPPRFAAGVALQMTARELGGALGIAALAALLTSRGTGVDAFADVFLFCAGAAALTALSGLRLAPAAEVAEPALPLAAKEVS